MRKQTDAILCRLKEKRGSIQVFCLSAVDPCCCHKKEGMPDHYITTEKCCSRVDLLTCNYTAASIIFRKEQPRSKHRKSHKHKEKKKSRRKKSRKRHKATSESEWCSSRLFNPNVLVSRLWCLKLKCGKDPWARVDV